MKQYNKETYVKHCEAYYEDKLEYYAPHGEWIEATAPPHPLHNSTSYRIKPAARFRAWTNAEVPLGAWIRSKLWPITAALITGIDNKGRISAGGNWYWTCNEALTDCVYSTDQGKTWQPCGVNEAN